MCTLSLGWNSAPWFLLSPQCKLNDFHFVITKIRWGMISHEKNNILREMSEQHNQTPSVFISWARECCPSVISHRTGTLEPMKPAWGDGK